MARRSEPIFLERETYRRRRLIDAVRVLPVIGAVAFLIPILGAPGGERATAAAGLFLFGAWFALIVLTAILTRRLARAPGGVAADPREPGVGAAGGGDGAP